MEQIIEIRPSRVGDAAGINAMRRMPGVFENILGMPSEQLSRTESWLSNMGPNEHQFVAAAQQDGQELIIGCAGLTIAGGGRTRHCGSVGIMVHRDWQGKKVGSMLMQAVLDLADNWLMLKRVELGVYPDNVRAIALYKKFGFEEEGVKRAAAIRAGQYVDEVIMGRIR